jgi:hypothetical protein
VKEFSEQVRKEPRITLGISTQDNIQALLLCLGSVLNGMVVPARIQIRFTGALPGFGTFYFEQLADLARLQGIEFEWQRAADTGVRDARDWHLATCPTPYLWMVDDDVIPAWDCLMYLTFALVSLSNKDWGWLAAVKVDVNNRRNYPDYHTKVRELTDPSAGVFSQNHFYAKEYSPDFLPMLDTLDSGNVLLNCVPLRERGVNFNCVPGSANAGGEDALFAHAATKNLLLGYLAVRAQSFHIEKERLIFTEQQARAEMIRLGKKLYDISYSSTIKLPGARKHSKDRGQLKAMPASNRNPDLG